MDCRVGNLLKSGLRIITANRLATNSVPPEPALIRPTPARRPFVAGAASVESAPEPSAVSNHIRVFPDTLEASHCQRLIDRFEASTELERCERENGYSFTQFNITKHWADESELLLSVFLKYFNIYRREVAARFWPANFALEHIRMKRYLPNGHDAFLPHVDVVDQLSARRFMTGMIYLNEPDGGETIFPDLELSIAPARGRLLAFPPLWLFPHAGLAPRTQPKYIVHTYLCYGA
jgi:prolyl 4-hydroxylase